VFETVRRVLRSWIHLAWIVPMAFFGVNVVGPRVFLVYSYGWTRAHREGLSVVRWSKAQPAEISNGDVIDGGGAAIAAFGAGAGFTLSLGPMLVFSLMRRRAESGPGG
jgi:hypothetical protein